MKKKITILLLLLFIIIAIITIWLEPDNSKVTFPLNRFNAYIVLKQQSVFPDASLSGKAIFSAQHGYPVVLLKKHKNCCQILLANGQEGYVPSYSITTLRIVALKDEKRIIILKGTDNIKTFETIYNIDIPTGRYFLISKKQLQKNDSNLFLSYFFKSNCRKALINKKIPYKQYRDFLETNNNKQEFNTNNQPAVCITTTDDKNIRKNKITLKKQDLQKMLQLVSGVPVIMDIYTNKKSFTRHTSFQTINGSIVRECNQLLQKGCSYTELATRYHPLTYPLGDIDRSMGVCSDLEIRALRTIGIDLQVLVHEDALQYPDAYPFIQTANYHIDHRRVKNLKYFFDRHSFVFSNQPPSKNKNWLPGDIVLFDTGVRNGTEYDHIGIVSSTRKNGRYQVFNLWTIGYELNEMDLLNGDYPKIVGHYRLFNPYYYDGTIVL